MHSDQPVFTREAACQDCYRCLRECPVKAINVSNGMAAVDSGRCIYCGTCIGVCPAEAKTVRDDVPLVKQLIARKSRIIVSLAPSYVAAFPEGLRRLTAGLRLLGFTEVQETAQGAHLVSGALAKWMNENYSRNTLPLLTISTACTAVVTLICKHYPALVPSLSPLCSPMIAHGRYLRNGLDTDTGVVFIGPCPAKKSELAGGTAPIDAVISFADLRTWFTAEGILLDALAPADTPSAAALLPAAHGALYPIEGGMIESIRSFGPLPKVEMHTIAGLDSVMAALEDLDPSSLTTPLFLELLACKGGCINGVCMPNSGQLLVKREGIRTYAAGLKRFGEQVAVTDTAGSFVAVKPAVPEFSNDQVRSALQRIGKHTLDDELNCGGCGYLSCRAFARVLLENRAEPAMCVSYMRSLAMKKANALMQSMPAGAVIVGKDLSIIECNLRFVQIAVPELVEHFQATQSLANASVAKIASLGRYFRSVLATGMSIADKQIRIDDHIVSLSVFTIEPGLLVAGIIQDITQPAVRKDQTIRKVREVSRRQLTMVQQIASLLGENAAESETLLSEIIASFSDGDDERGSIP